MSDHSIWATEVSSIYERIRSHKDPYYIEVGELEIRVDPDVFSPKYFADSAWFAEVLPSIIKEGSLLEIGTGTGVVALSCVAQGIKVHATDINPAACKCAKYNSKNLGLSLEVSESDIYDSLSVNEKFDYIFWNHPFNNSEKKVTDYLLRAGFDYQYSGLQKYVAGAEKYLANPGKGLLLGTGSQADIKRISSIARDSGYELFLLASEEMPLGEGTLASNDFRIYEFRLV